MSRALAVTRMHLTDRLTMFGLPTAILAASFLINVLIFAVEPVGSRSSGGVAAIFVVLLIASVMLTARAMSFALSMGASRRAFAVGTGAVGGVLALTFGALLLILNRIESASDGWWLHGHFFGFSWLNRHNLAADWVLATVLLLAMFLLGALVATIWLRWKQLGLLVASVTLVLVLGGLAVLITWQRDWHAVGHWFIGLSPLGASGWLALLCAALAGTAYLCLRRVEV